MMKSFTSGVCALLALMLFPEASRGQETTGLTLTCSEGLLQIFRDKRANSNGYEHDLTAPINATDCDSDEEWTFRHTALSRPQSLEDAVFVVYRGSNCNSQELFDQCTVEEPNPMEAVSVNEDGLFTLTAQEMVPNGCDGSANTTKLWLTLFPNNTTEFGNKLEICELAVAYDMAPPEAPTTVELSPGDEAITTTWDDSPAADADEYYVCHSDNSGGENECTGGDSMASVESCIAASDCSCVQVDEATRQTRIDELSNEGEYAIAVAARDRADNYGPLSPAVCEAPVELDDFFELYAESDGGFKHCFVATAAYGGEIDHPDLDQLRWLRDRVILRVPGGNRLITEYYRRGPRWASEVEDHPLVAKALQASIAGTAATIRVARTGAGVPLLVFLGLFGACLHLRRRRNP